MNPEQIADVLDDAADYIEQYGHFKGDGHGPGDIDTAPACAIGAINSALNWGIGTSVVADALQGVVPADSLVAWNDAPERTKQQVLDAFRKAAKQQRMQAVDL